MYTKTSILPGETLFDVAVRVYGHTQGAKQLAADNDISMTDVLTPGMELKIDDSISFKSLKAITIAMQTTELPNQAVAEPYQNMFDLALQLYGSLQGVFQLAKDNDKDMTSEINPGEILKGRKDPIDKLVYEFYKGRGIKPATGLTSEESADIKPEGIEFWAIEFDFIVS
ncbi:LysM peptidoglycan-binding domain-containing protein [Carboxylicivirga linearis]|uniref:LysM peptidoglycan-binding domain-containing protein n=1 Tax=Carboxylicivirga linearis TaxID=1628157 RepID=A0ABS5K0N9_9BACT|nr:LysM peptidoglycan-binding domain-containing protein [Carboxylicivirga linearis]MBS2100716.1 LysM peptidoglycan-binding domain-containing protein [Carboxylicivirga linearis]